MDLRHITESDWAHMEQRYPDAYAYLSHCSLIGEWENLIHDKAIGLTLNDWQVKRLAELDALYSK